MLATKFHRKINNHYLCVTCRSLDCGRKLENPSRTQRHRVKIPGQEQNPQPFRSQVTVTSQWKLPQSLDPIKSLCDPLLVRDPLEFYTLYYRNKGWFSRQRRFSHLSNSLGFANLQTSNQPCLSRLATCVLGGEHFDTLCRVSLTRRLFQKDLCWRRKCSSPTDVSADGDTGEICQQCEHDESQACERSEKAFSILHSSSTSRDTFLMRACSHKTG